MPLDARARAAGNLLFALLCAIMIGLAAGALWMLLALYAHATLAWVALPLGALLGWLMRAWVAPRRRDAAALAALATLLAAAYMCCLLATARLAALMGMGFTETLHRAGPGMLLVLARLSTSWGVLGLFALGAVVAAATAWYTPATPVNRRAP
jgi:vitamin B12 transport system permease protein